MPADDDRTRRRLGDDTKSRIANLASGWSVAASSPDDPGAPDADPPRPGADPDTVPTPKVAAPDTAPPPTLAAPDTVPTPKLAAADIATVAPPRKKQRTNPPPAPGSPERKAYESAIIATSGDASVRDDETEKRPLRTHPAAGSPSSTGSQAIVRSEAGPGSTQPYRSAPPPPPPPPSRPRGPTGPHGAVVQPATSGSTQPHSGVPVRLKVPSVPPPPPGSLRTKPASAPPPFGVRSKPSSVPPAIATPTPPRTVIPVPALASEAGSSPLKAAVLDAAARAVTENLDEEIDDISSPVTGPTYPRAAFGPQPAPEGNPSAPAETHAFATEPRTFSSESRTPAVIVDATIGATGAARGATSPAATRADAPMRAVPVGEFDGGARTIEEQSTAQRDAAEALLGIPAAETPVEELLDDDVEDARGGPVLAPRADATPATERFERGDPTQNAPPDATEIQPSRGAKHPTGGTLRASAQLRRKRGLYGDVRYVFTALFGVRRSHRELAALEHRQGLRQASRRRHLITLGRTAAVMDALDHPTLGKSREQLALIEDERSKHAGAVAASDAELERVRRERENKRAQHALATSEADAALAELAQKLEPLEKEAAAARKRASELREEVHRIEKKIAETESSLSSVKAEKVDKASIHADIATLKANREAVLRDEPVIAAELDSLNPRIAAMEGTRSELHAKKAEVEKAEQEDQRRTLELLEAIGAKRKVVERAAADAEAARDNALFELGERLYVDRPRELTPQLAPIDSIDLEMGEGERRSMEVKEILSNIDKAKFARGLAMIILALGALASLAWLIHAGV